MPSSNVNILEILQAREERAKRQSRFRSRYKKTLLSFSMNIPGPVKDTPLVRLAFYEGRRQLFRCCLPDKEKLCFDAAGPSLLWAVDKDAATVKAAAEAIEERDELSRLFDMDVLDASGEKLSRHEPRKCLLCGEDARICGRSRRHSLDELTAETHRRLMDFAAAKHAEKAVEALLEELYATPKPGLVDRCNSGAHTDMDLPLFEKSAESLRHYFNDAFRIGYATAELTEREAMAALRERGIVAEKEMFAATGGVNTHKGMVYTLGLLLGGAGRAYVRRGEPTEQAAALVNSDFVEVMAAAAERRDSHGAKLYADGGIRGIRGEAAAGFPHAWQAVRRLRDTLDPVRVLIEIMSELEDTNVLHRAGEQGAAWVRETARQTAALPRQGFEEAVLALDAEFIRRNISPGGAADVLATAIFLKKIFPYWYESFEQVD